MAKTKAELLEEARSLGIEVDPKAKVAEIRELIDKVVPDTAKKEKPATELENGSGDESEETKVAKAGKRSAKALREEAERQAKEDRKASDETPEAPKKKPIKPARPRIERRAKGYRKSAEQLEKGKAYGLEEAVKLAKATSHVKFDATVELHVNLGVDPKVADQNVRDTLVLPAGSGKQVKIAVFTEDTADDLTAKFDKGVTDFDVLIASPKLMPKLGKCARLLGPRGLMPNPKSGTVTDDVDRAVAEAKAGRVEYRVDSTGIVHLGIGKVSFSEQQLLDNLNAVLTSIKNNKPASVKGTYLQRAYLTTSMGPSVAVDVASMQ